MQCAGSGSERTTSRCSRCTTVQPALMLLLRLLLAGGLFGFGLAMLLDRWLGGWGILLAAAMCTAGGLVLYRRLAPPRREENV